MIGRIFRYLLTDIVKDLTDGHQSSNDQYLLQEDGDRLLQEDGSKIILDEVI